MLGHWIQFDWSFDFYQHQQQVASAVERAKQVTMTELNAVIGVNIDDAFLFIYISFSLWLCRLLAMLNERTGIFFFFFFYLSHNRFISPPFNVFLSFSYLVSNVRPSFCHLFVRAAENRRFSFWGCCWSISFPSSRSLFSLSPSPVWKRPRKNRKENGRIVFFNLTECACDSWLRAFSRTDCREWGGLGDIRFVQPSVNSLPNLLVECVCLVPCRGDWCRRRASVPPLVLPFQLIFMEESKET